ncbi:hypothetical protein ACIL8L_26920, partial [Escherichia coli]
MKNPELQNLTDYSPSDAPWDAHRSVSDDVGGIYLLAAEYERYGARMASCGGLLRFGWSTLKETGEMRLTQPQARFSGFFEGRPPEPQQTATGGHTSPVAL